LQNHENKNVLRYFELTFNKAGPHCDLPLFFSEVATLISCIIVSLLCLYIATQGETVIKPRN